jgi:hypothetical protein
LISVCNIRNTALVFQRLSIVLALTLPAVMIAASIARAASITRAAGPQLLGQDDSTDEDDDAIPTDQVDKYIAVYSAMQKDHNLSVEQAASKQGLTVDQFRSLEDRIEQNSVIHERVLNALRSPSTVSKASSAAASGSSSGAKPDKSGSQ